MPLYNNGNWFEGPVALAPPEGMYRVRRLGSTRPGSLRHSSTLRFTTAYQYKHEEEEQQVVAAPPPRPTTVEEWLSSPLVQRGATSLMEGPHGGSCCGMKHVRKFWTGDFGENRESAPTKGNFLRLQSHCTTIDSNVEEEDGEGLLECVLTEDQLSQADEFGFTWLPLLTYLGFSNVSAFKNPNTDERICYVFHYFGDGCQVDTLN